MQEMANVEAQIITTALENLRKIYQILMARLPGRSLESIKGKRRNAEYKKLVSDLTDSLTCSSHVTAPSTSSTPVVGTSSAGIPPDQMACV